MTCHVSISISSPWQETTTATCEARYEPRGGTAQNSAEQLRRLQEACLAAVSAAALAAASPPRQSATQARPTLRQLARLYRVATRIMSFDLRQLQSLSARLYQKPLEELSMIEVSGVIGTLNAILKGMVDLNQVFAQPINGRDVGV